MDKNSNFDADFYKKRQRQYELMTQLYKLTDNEAFKNRADYFFRELKNELEKLSQ